MMPSAQGLTSHLTGCQQHGIGLPLGNPWSPVESIWEGNPSVSMSWAYLSFAIFEICIHGAGAYHGVPYLGQLLHMHHCKQHPDLKLAVVDLQDCLQFHFETFVKKSGSLKLLGYPTFMVIWAPRRFLWFPIKMVEQKATRLPGTKTVSTRQAKVESCSSTTLAWTSWRAGPRPVS